MPGKFPDILTRCNDGTQKSEWIFANSEYLYGQ